MRLNAYVMVADPAFLAASVASYYDAVERIVVSYDESHRSWSGEPLPIDECLAELRHVDRDGKLDIQPGRYTHPELPPLDCETRQRQEAVEIASTDSEWVLQLDTDEVVTDLGVFINMLREADRAGVEGLEFPSRWLYARIASGRYLEACSRWWRPTGGYPGSLAVRSGAKLNHARQNAGGLFRVDFRARNTDPWHPPDARVDATVRVDQGVLHFSWIRNSEEMLRKAAISGHRDHQPWEAEIATWQLIQRYPSIGVALTPFRRKAQKSWLRKVTVPVDPSPRMVT